MVPAICVAMYSSSGEGLISSWPSMVAANEGEMVPLAYKMQYCDKVPKSINISMTYQRFFSGAPWMLPHIYAQMPHRFGVLFVLSNTSIT